MRTMEQSKFFRNTSPERNEICLEVEEVIFEDKMDKPITKPEKNTLIAEMKFAIEISKNSLKKGENYNPYMPKISDIAMMHPLKVF